MSYVEQDLELTIYTRDKLDKVEKVKSFLKDVMKFSRADKLEMVYVEKNSREKTTPINFIEDYEIDSRLKTGGINFRDVDSKLLCGYIQSGENFNSLSVQMVDSLVTSDENKSQFIDLFTKSCLNFDCELGFCYLAEAPGYNGSYRSSRESIASGIRDVYWLNFYGEKLVNLIGDSKLRSLKGCYSKSFDKRGIMFQISDEPKCIQVKDAVMTSIGSEYFVGKKKQGLLNIFSSYTNRAKLTASY